ncbi:MAG: hypothetical protein ACOCZ5_01760 [bacterium]
MKFLVRYSSIYNLKHKTNNYKLNDKNLGFIGTIRRNNNVMRLIIDESIYIYAQDVCQFINCDVDVFIDFIKRKLKKY